MTLSPEQVQDAALAMSPGHRLHLILMLSASLEDEEDDELLDDPEWPAELARHIARAEAEMAEARAAAMVDAAQRGLAGSGDAGAEEALEAESAWAEEIRTRVDDYRSGRAQPVPSDEVFARLRDQLA